MFRKFWNGITYLGNCLSSYFILVIRMYWGYQFMITGFGKLTFLSRVAEYFYSLGIPFPHFNAFLAGSTELIGGILLFLGLFSRVAAIPLAFVLTIAFLTEGHQALITLISKQDPSLIFSNTAFLFMYAILIVFFFGPGKISIDYWLTGANKTKTMP